MEANSAATIAGPQPAAPASVSMYAAVGAELINFELDVASADITRRGSVRLPARVQYAWRHSSRPVLYVSSADRTPGLQGDQFFLNAFAIGADGELAVVGDTVPVPSRPIHMSTDRPTTHLLTAYSQAPGLTVHEIAADGSIGQPVPVPAGFDYGIYPHQIRTTPDSRHAVLVDRGDPDLPGKAYRAGAVKVLSYADGHVSNLATINWEGQDGIDQFNPRHLDFHPTLPLVFLALEQQNKLGVLHCDEQGLGPSPLFVKNMLAEPDNVRPRQLGGTVHVHPDGRTVYVANRNDSYEGFDGNRNYHPWTTPDPVPIFPGGENNIAVFHIDESTGEPTLVQNADSQGLFPRCFALDPSGSVLITANMRPSRVREGDGLRTIPAGFGIFRIAGDGTLELVRTRPIDIEQETVWWMGIVERPRAKDVRDRQ